MRKYVKIISLILVVLIICSGAAYATRDKLDINQLTDNQLRQELLDIKGIGAVTAERVIMYRATNKPVTVGELDAIKGIGEKRLALIKKKFR